MAGWHGTGLGLLVRVACVLGLSASASASAWAWAGGSASDFAQRDRDWRNGAIVYQVLVDRYVPSANLDAKRALYPAPKVLRDWSEPARPGVELKDAKLNSQELDFWGGDLQSLTTRPGPVHTILASANGVKTAPIKARDDVQAGRLG